MPQTLHYLNKIVQQFRQTIDGNDRVNTMLKGKERIVQVTSEDGVFNFSIKDGEITTPVEGAVPHAHIKVSGPSNLLKEIAIGNKRIGPLIISKRIQLDAGMMDILLMKMLAGM